MAKNEVPLVPAGGRILEGINKRKRIRELLAAGKSKFQICEEMGFGMTAYRKHLKIIEAEDKARKGAA